MLRDSAQEQRYLVLNISKGLRFNCLKHVGLRISAVFQNERLTSNSVLATPEPNFKVNFVWCTTARHLNLLQKWCCNIEITITATSAGKTWTAGCAMIGIQHAQLLSPDVELTTRHFPVYDMKTETRMVLRPELVVTLSIRSEPPLDIDGQLHSVNLAESSRPVSPVDRIVRKPCSSTSSATTRTKKGHEEESQENLNLLSQPHSYQKQQIERNRSRSPKTKDRLNVSSPMYKVLTPDEKLTIGMQRSWRSRTPLPPQRTFEPLSKIRLRQDQKMYKNVKEPQHTKDRNNSVQTTCSSTETKQEVPKSHDCTPILPNNMITPSRIRLIVQNIARSKMALLGVYGSSSTFQMIGQPPPTRKPEVQIRKSPNHTAAPQKNMNILKIRNATSSVLMVLAKATEAKEKEIQIQKSHDQTPTSPPVRAMLGSSSKTHVKVKKYVRFKEDTDVVRFKEDTDVTFKEDTDMQQC